MKERIFDDCWEKKFLGETYKKEVAYGQILVGLKSDLARRKRSRRDGEGSPNKGKGKNIK